MEVLNDTNRSLGELALDVLTRLCARIKKLRKESVKDIDADDLHKIRVTLRRLRAALDLFAPIVILPNEVTDKKVGAVARAFGNKRDNDVLIEKFKEISTGTVTTSDLVDSAEKQLHREDKKLTKQVEKVAKSKSFEKLLEALDSWLKSLTFSVRASEPASTGIPMLLRITLNEIKAHSGWKLLATTNLERDAASLIAGEAGDTIHDLRKLAKKLRYQLEFVEDYESVTSRHNESLKQLQDCLGAVQDMRLLMVFLDKALGKNWNEDLRKVDQNISATLKANLFEAKRIAPQIQHTLTY